MKSIKAWGVYGLLALLLFMAGKVWLQSKTIGGLEIKVAKGRTETLAAEAKTERFRLKALTSENLATETAKLAESAVSLKKSESAPFKGILSTREFVENCIECMKFRDAVAFELEVASLELSKATRERDSAVKAKKVWRFVSVVVGSTICGIAISQSAMR